MSPRALQEGLGGGILEAPKWQIIFPKPPIFLDYRDFVGSFLNMRFLWNLFFPTSVLFIVENGIVSVFMPFSMEVFHALTMFLCLNKSIFPQ